MSTMKSVVFALAIVAAVLVQSNATAQVATVQHGARIYPWDTRPKKCLSAPEPIDFCREPNHWNDYAETVGRVQTLLADPDTDTALLDRAAAELASSGERFKSGEFLFEAWYYAVLTQFGADQGHATQMADRWRGAPGASAYAVMSQAIQLYNGAWSARGNGLAATVSPEAWSVYQKTLERADDVLDAAPASVKGSGPWHLLKVQIAFDHKGLAAKRLDRLEAAVRAWPNSVTLFNIAMSRSQPQWGGSFELMEGVARLAEKSATLRSGAAMYALVYERVYRGNSWSTLRESKANWTTMKDGFREFEKTSDRPARIWRNFAGLACQMRDRAEARRLYVLHDAQSPDARADRDDACRVFADGG